MKKLNNEKEIEKLEEARKNTSNKKEDARIKAIILRLKGFKIHEISEKLDVSTKSISNWIKEYKDYSISGLMNKKRTGNRRNMSFEEEKEFLKQFEEMAQKGQIITAKEIEKAYIELVGHSIGGTQIYYVLKRHGFRKIMPRSRHPKKANEEAIEASKKLNPK
ncbi:helix-turn-helix domain-containing protein, partial [Peptoniphilus sp. SGI.035]|uniref:helix-turn-helix domain-containing protein n=1 Tax=Peptoniphilus sp. SGI.035 TaxID=3420564 RepID=UPI003D01B084